MILVVEERIYQDLPAYTGACDGSGIASSARVCLSNAQWMMVLCICVRGAPHGESCFADSLCRFVTEADGRAFFFALILIMTIGARHKTLPLW